MKKSQILFLLSTMMFVAVSAQALTVDNLRVQNLKNPSGVDTSSPAMSWKLHSDDRGVVQTAYKVTITSADGELVYDGAFVESDRSTNVILNNVALNPSTRYFWSVTVQDNKGNEATSEETAWFDTGLMDGGWGDARWIKATTSPYGTYADDEVVENYTIEAVMKIKELASGICFAGYDTNNYYMWQVNIYNGNNRLRPHRWQNGAAACLDEVAIPDEAGVAQDAVFTMRIEVSGGGKVAATYINDVFIDEREGDFTYGIFGIRSAYEYGLIETASYDSFKVTTDTGSVLYDYDFETENPFINSTIEDGWLNVQGGSTYGVYSWLVTEEQFLRYTVEADMILVRDNAAIVFSATSNKTYFMWQINTFDNANPMVRCHVYNNSTTPSLRDNPLTQFTKSDFLGQKRHIRIEVVGNTIYTYIDDILVNTYIDTTGILAFGDIGLRVDNTSATPKEEAYFDNLKVTVYDEDGNYKVTVNEDFENPEDCIFLDPVIENIDGNNMCHMEVSGKENRMMQDSSAGMPMYRKEFTISKAVKSAYLYTTALGVYDLYMNGERVGHVQEDGSTVYDELKPGWTDYTKRVFYSEHEVSSLLVDGANAVGAVVASGWWAGDIAKDYYGSPNTAFLAKIVITYEDGTTDVIDSDLTWAVSTDGPLRSGEIYDGEIYDARLESDWSKSGVNLGSWYAVSTDRQFKGVIQSYQGPPVRTLDDLARSPQTTTIYEGTTATGTTYGEVAVVNTLTGAQPIPLKAGQTAIVDFGQNFAGWVVFTANGVSGTRLHVRFSEMLNDTGDESRGNDGPGGSIYVASLREAKAELYYTLAGNSNGDTYKPSTTFWGFRYCEITSNVDVEITDIYGLPISSSYIDTGHVETSSDVVNRLFSNIVWGQRSNLLSIPTDCPQRAEREGWTGDTQVFSNTGMLNADVTAFYRKWITDLCDGQREDGAYYCIAPISWTMCGQAAWSDAGIIVPWNVYQMTGDLEVIREHYDSMVKYMDWLSTQTGETYTYEGAGTDYGDWLSFATTDSRYVSVAYYAYDAQLMTKMSRLLSVSEDDEYARAADEYEELFNNIRDEYQARYCSSTGYLREQTQTAYLLMLRFNLYKDEEQREKAISRLERIITGNKETLSTGFVGTAILNQTLSSVGLTDKAYNLLLQRNCPSWLYSVDQGATTIWERWDSYTIESGFNTPSMNSFNHYSYGAVGEWMYRYMAGIDIDEENPAYKHIILRPCIDSRETLPDGQERIKSATASHDSFYGTVSAGWSSLDGKLDTYSVEVPANTTATVYLPVDSEDSVVYESGTEVSGVDGIVCEGYADGCKVYTIGSGKYEFSTDVSTGIKKKKEGEHTFRVHPNPVSTTLSITSTDNISRVDVYNMSGVLVSQTTGDGNNTIDMSGVASGSYVLRAVGDHGTYVEKVLKI